MAGAGRERVHLHRPGEREPGRRHWLAAERSGVTALLLRRWRSGDDAGLEGSENPAAETVDATGRIVTQSRFTHR